MKTILFIISKEFRQIFRNKGMLPIIFIIPSIQLLVLSNAASFEVHCHFHLQPLQRVKQKPGLQTKAGPRSLTGMAKAELTGKPAPRTAEVLWELGDRAEQTAA